MRVIYSHTASKPLTINGQRYERKTWHMRTYAERDAAKLGGTVIQRVGDGKWEQAS